jgi:Putative peptidoglycan binding domain
MTSGRVAGGLIGVVLAASACAHTHAVEPAPTPEPAAQHHPSQKERGAGKAKREEPKGDNAVPVATSADALLAPGGVDQIREKLKAQGFLEDGASLETGLRTFQEKHDLPATGVPDHATVSKLGLDPERIFRQAAAK